jgi:polysaccharide biosynthesis/export protein
MKAHILTAKCIENREHVMRGNKIQFGILAAVFLCLAIQASAGQGPDTARSTSATASAAASTAEPRPELQHRPRYAIQRSDNVTITFPVSPEYNQTITVQPDGYISLMGAGSIRLEGLNLEEAQTAIHDAYVKAKVLKDPLVTVDLKDFQRPYFSVNGQVLKPGQYELRRDTTLTEALAIAGGLSSSSKQQVFLLHRVSSGWAEVRSYEIKKILNGKDPSEDPHLQAGDMLFVPENFITKFRKYVPYTFGLYYNPAL